MRLLPKRDDDCGGAIAREEPKSERSRDQGCVHQHAAFGSPLPLRHVRRNHRRGAARGQGNGCLKGTMLSKPEPLIPALTRRSFVKAGGALLVSFSLPW